MTDFLIKSTISLFILFGIYYLFLEKEKMHLFNRFYLLFAIVFSFTVPFITIEIIKNIPQVITEYESLQTPLSAKAKYDEPLNYGLWFGIIYGLTVLMLSVRFINNIIKIRNKIKHNPIVNYKNARLVLVKEKELPHTFLNTIFINENDYREQNIENELYIHELTHVQQRHTLDILFIEIVKTLFWFNPVLILYKRAIQLNHEFLADEKVVVSYNNTPFYQQLLLSKADGNRTISLASNLNYSLTKKRLIMMTKTTSTSVKMLKQLALLPLLTALIFFLCTKTVAQEIKSTNKTKAVTKEKYYDKTVFKLMDKTGRIISTKKYSELTPEQIKQLPAGYKNKDGVSPEVTEWAIYNKTSDMPMPVEKTVKINQVKFPRPKDYDTKAKLNKSNPEQVYNQADSKPEFSGGIEAFYKYIGENFKIPADLKEKAKIIAQFIIEKDGTISNIKILNGSGFGAGEETTRVLNESPKWTPGKIDGQNVRVMYTLPISIMPKA